MTTKREQIERALGPLMPEAFVTPEGRIAFNAMIIRLAEQAIVIEAEVEHTFDPLDGEPWTSIQTKPDDFGIRHKIFYQGHHGKQGKAWAIIVSREEEDGND